MTINFDGRLGMIIGGGIILFAVMLGLLIARCMDELEPIFIHDFLHDDKKSFNRSCLGWLITSSVIAVGCIVTAIIGAVGLGERYRASYNNHKYNIVSLERDYSVEGRFCLGSGYIEGSQYYYFYTETSRGLHLEKLSHEYTFLVETDEYTPSVYDWKESNCWKHYFTIYCPVGTIVKEFHAQEDK